MVVGGVVGGVAGGASFAARMRRLDETAKIVIFEKGDYISFANCGLPYHIGQTIKDRDNLIIQTPEKFKSRFNIDVRTRSEVIGINIAKKEIMIKSVDSTYVEPYDSLVLSPGADPIKPPLPGIDNPHVMILRTIPDMDKIKTRIDSGSVKRQLL